MAFKLMSYPGMLSEFPSIPVVVDQTVSLGICPICRFVHWNNTPCMQGIPEWQLHVNNDINTLPNWVMMPQVEINT